ncbi:hypothetical protein P153DRAFT_25160 [Dothidotthia symphoricarpi CBS 119687]|uniref:Uncharacterized protein n=1 Tax=Dothidotthia symphoricarpi CBS 119687 TaxID=1392245 RepID=A0A6A6AAC8_9PLEO|nr:uncharacterized protein P153DRAFT_25160 [Dothidotthia symphoricarpi CBS 119687]KAF2128770.1 hypothetical protein P153DRAFT_25160 [Dothidotthia symphoricarpi CBS 119687]
MLVLQRAGCMHRTPCRELRLARKSELGVLVFAMFQRTKVLGSYCCLLICWRDAIFVLNLGPCDDIAVFIGPGERYVHLVL